MTIEHMRNDFDWAKPKYSEKKTAPVPLCQQQNPHEVAMLQYRVYKITSLGVTPNHFNPIQSNTQIHKPF